jgi:hypothetical protein
MSSPRYLVARNMAGIDRLRDLLGETNDELVIVDLAGAVRLPVGIDPRHVHVARGLDAPDPAVLDNVLARLALDRPIAGTWAARPTEEADPITAELLAAMAEPIEHAEPGAEFPVTPPGALTIEAADADLGDYLARRFTTGLPGSFTLSAELGLIPGDPMPTPAPRPPIPVDPELITQAVEAIIDEAGPEHPSRQIARALLAALVDATIDAADRTLLAEPDTEPVRFDNTEDAVEHAYKAHHASHHPECDVYGPGLADRHRDDLATFVRRLRYDLVETVFDTAASILGIDTALRRLNAATHGHEQDEHPAIDADLRDAIEALIATARAASPGDRIVSGLAGEVERLLAGRPITIHVAWAPSAIEAARDALDAFLTPDGHRSTVDTRTLEVALDALRAVTGQEQPEPSRERVNALAGAGVALALAADNLDGAVDRIIRHVPGPELGALAAARKALDTARRQWRDAAAS